MNQPDRKAALSSSEQTSGHDAVLAGVATSAALLESASEGILMVDERGLIRVVNASAERMFGYRREELIGAPLEVLLPDRFRGTHQGHRTHYFRAPRVRPMGLGLDLSASRKDGTEFPVEISLSYVNAAGGRLAMAFVTDITERKRSEEQLRRQREGMQQADKLAALGTMAAGLAHEINNPIGIISSRIELMLAEAEAQHLPAAVREDLAVLQRNVQRVGRIAQGLLSFARQSPQDRTQLSLNRVVEETLLLTEQQLTRTGVRVRTALDPALPPVRGHPNALEQVLLNLLANAREALSGAPDREIRIATHPAPERSGWVQLVVADTGPGMPPDVVAKVFDPFFTTKPEGTGLGLSVSYGIVKDHGGVIEVHSEPGKGTTFCLDFPIAPRPADPAPPS